MGRRFCAASGSRVTHAHKPGGTVPGWSTAPRSRTAPACERGAGRKWCAGRARSHPCAGLSFACCTCVRTGEGVHVPCPTLSCVAYPANAGVEWGERTYVVPYPVPAPPLRKWEWQRRGACSAFTCPVRVGERGQRYLSCPYCIRMGGMLFTSQRGWGVRVYRSKGGVPVSCLLCMQMGMPPVLFTSKEGLLVQHLHHHHDVQGRR